MVKIAYILTPIEFGGSEKVNVTFLKNVNRDRFDIHLFLLIRPWEKDNVFINKIKNDNFIVTKIPVAKRNPSEGRDYLRVLRCLMYLYQILSKDSFDIVHSHGYFADIISTVACKFLRIPNISTCHGFIANNNNLKIYNMLDRYMLRSCNKVIAVSSGIKNELVNRGVNTARITEIQNAVQCTYDKDQFIKFRAEIRSELSINEDVFLIGFVGRLSQEKGVNFLIEAAARLKNKSSDFKLAIVGDGYMKSELVSLSNSKGLNNYVVFTGFKEDIEKWSSAFDVLVLPSLTEGTPMALLEAMSMGIPVIATAVGGVPGVVKDGANGFLVEPGDCIALYDKINMLKNNPTVRKKVASEATNTIKERFDVNIWCRRIENEYDSLMQSELIGIKKCR